MFDGETCSGSARAYVQLGVDRTQVLADGPGTEPKLVRHLGIGESFRREPQDLNLAAGQAGRERPRPMVGGRRFARDVQHLVQGKRPASIPGGGPIMLTNSRSCLMLVTLVHTPVGRRQRCPDRVAE